MSTPPDPAEQAVHAAISASMAPESLRPDRASELLHPLLQRVHQSALAHKDYLTLRREEGRWSEVADGVSIRRLRADDCVEIDLVKLGAGAVLPELGMAVAQEWLLMDGHLEASGGARASRLLPPLSYAVVGAQTQGPWLRAGSASILYRRTLRYPAWLPAEEARWWHKATQTMGWRSTSEQAWGPALQGVAMLSLCVSEDVVSMLVRMETGARGADHGHSLNEDCMVLSGDMYLGDILLRAGDYQLAPVGGSHFEIASDDGALFYFHGALDTEVFGKASA